MADPVALVLGGLVLIVLVAALSKRTGIASPLLLLAVGIGAGYLPFVHVGEIPHTWILDFVLPPLLYATAVNLPIRDLRRDFGIVVGLAVVLVLLSTIGTGLILNALLPTIDVFAALALGAVVSPTDAVAATAIAKRLGLPERVVSVLEGESLLNDATALTLLAAAVEAESSGSISLSLVGVRFVLSVVIGVAVGLVVGLISVEVRARLGDPVLTTAISFVVPFAAFFPADAAHGSGVLATVVAGIVTGIGGRRRFDGTQRVNDGTNWRTVQFVLEEGVFLAMGLQLHELIDQVLEHGGSLLQPVAIGVLVVVVLFGVRAGFVAVGTMLLRRSEQQRLARADHGISPPDDTGPGRRAARRRRVAARRRADLEVLRSTGTTWSGGTVVAWAGMRGVVTLAAAQSLSFPGNDADLTRAVLVLIAFTVAVVSLAVFGGTLPAVIRLNGVQGLDQAARRSELAALVQQIFAAGAQVLDDPDQLVIEGVPADERVVARVRERYTRPPATEPSSDHADDAAMTAREQAFVLRRRIRDAARAELLEASATGTYSSTTISAARRLLDIEDAREDTAIDGI